MKAVALVEPGRVELIEKASPVLEDEYGALLRPLIVAPCTSDVHTIFHGGSKKKDNLIMGHESVCQVIAIGKNVKDFKVGDVVAVPAITPSWDSLDIQDGNLMHAGAPFSGHKLGRTIDGVFAERVYLPFADLNLAHIPEGVSAEQALMTVDVVSTGFTAVEEAEVSFGDNVVVFGIGAIGLAAVIGAKLSGAARIIVVGTKKVSVELAMQYGATDVINYKIGDVVEQIRRLGIRIDKAIICAGGIITSMQAQVAIESGAKLFSSPIFQTNLLKISKDKQLPFLAGTSTANEAYTAWKSRIPVVKIYPITAMGGVEYLKNLLRPMPFLSVIPQGDVKLSEIKDYLDAGALAVGVGRNLINAGSYSEITKRARTTLEQLNS